jgi:hypothetical protein
VPSHPLSFDYGRKNRKLPPIEEFEQKFRRVFGRDMTPHERRFFQLTSELVEEEQDERSKSA